MVIGDIIGTGKASKENVAGETPNLAARLQAMAEPNAIESRFEALHSAAKALLIGRHEELDVLVRRSCRAKAGEGQVLLVSGEPGIATSTRLSGGEQQRVAIARALAPRPQLLLLDELLSALDEKIRREMQAQLKGIQRLTGTTFVYVTHDQEEALTISDRVAVLNWGHLVQVDEPHALFCRPRTKFVAGFFRGSNVVEGQFARDDESSITRRLSVTILYLGTA